VEGMFILIPLLPFAAAAYFGWLGLRYVRAKEQANQIARGGLAPDRGELGRIEESLETLQRDVQALQERQAFMEKLLERPRPDTALPGPEVGRSRQHSETAGA